MNEEDTRVELIEPQLKDSGWGVVDGSKIRREYRINDGMIKKGGGRSKALFADFVLLYKNRKLAVVEAKSDELDVGEGVAQAKNYAEKLKLDTTFAANGKEIYQICMTTGSESTVENFPTPEELWNKSFSTSNKWLEEFYNVPFEDMSGTKSMRYYQEIAVNETMSAVADKKDRILLTLATGTGKTFIAFQIAWKLFQTRWNLKWDGSRRPRILFLADRNILADQAFNAFSAFPDDAMVRIRPKDIVKKGSVPTNGSLFFTIFQTFMSGPDGTPYFGQYPEDFFDFIIIDECHRGGANDESNWRSIMEYFSPAIQLGLTATPKRDDNVDTYEYFEEPVYVYSLKEGINDGFLTPFRVKRAKSTMDDYIYTSDDEIIEGEIEEGKLYTEYSFNTNIEIKEREASRIKVVLSSIDPNEKTLVFCANQSHALLIRDLINQNKVVKDPNYCVRVTADDGELGEKHLRDFQDNEKIIPTILTTSQKLSTGVDARNIRNIVLMRPIKSMIEFKQIIGRGTRLFEGKDYFTIYDFVKAYHHFSDSEWDGEPQIPVGGIRGSTKRSVTKPKKSTKAKEMVKIKLQDGKEIDYAISTSFWGPDGKPLSAQEFLENLYGVLPTLFKDETELRTVWANPKTRSTLLEQLEGAGYSKDDFNKIQKMIDAENSDLFDVLEHLAFSAPLITRKTRVDNTQSKIFDGLHSKQKEFLEFVLSQYIESGFEELSQEKLPSLLELKYQTLSDAVGELGDVEKTIELFIGFQEHLYAESAA